jgi:hypothetical protein
MKNLLLITTAILSLVASTTLAQATYDGSWDLLFVMKRGVCDPTYSFFVNISDGVVTHPSLVRFRGYVARSGAVRASVTVQQICLWFGSACEQFRSRHLERLFGK